MTDSPDAPGRSCYHCKEWIPAGEPHDCWTTTEAALTDHLSDDLRDAWERLRESAAELGEQRVYASGTCIMFARETCYAFVRPKKSLLELNIFLGREVRAPQIRRADRRSKTKVVHLVPITHRDEVEAPLTDWLQEAYSLQDVLSSSRSQAPAPARAAAKGKKAAARVESTAPSSPRTTGKKASSSPARAGKTSPPLQAKKVSTSRPKPEHASRSRSRVTKPASASREAARTRRR